MPAALFLSPHFDDVAFSCGGTVALLAARGWTTTLCTIFTRTVKHPTGFALACQLDKGLPAEIDYMALRRAEDDAAAATLRATNVERLGFPEAPHRGYESAAALFEDFAAGDDVAAPLTACFAERLPGYDIVFAPQALGNHVDHQHVRDSVRAVARSRRIDDRIVLYRDAPYAIRSPEAQIDASLSAMFPAILSLALDEAALAAKLDACAAYASQLRFQFGGERSMRATLRSFARSQAAGCGSAGTSERFRATSERALFVANRSCGTELA